MSFKGLVQAYLSIRSKSLQDDADKCSTVHFIETARSVLQEMPWIQFKDPKVMLHSCIYGNYTNFVDNRISHFLLKRLRKCAKMLYFKTITFLALKLCMALLVSNWQNLLIELNNYHIVYVGSGKTHYIKRKLKKCSEHITIAINEAFTPLSAISKLRSLPLYTTNIGLHFNFTILPTGVCKS